MTDATPYLAWGKSRSRLKRLCCASALALLALTAVAPQHAAADNRWKQSSTTWKAIDNCTRAAIRAYPDYTPEALAKREAHRRLCLRNANLPGGEDPPLPPR